MKRLFDFSVALIALPFVLFACLICCLLIWLDSPSNPIFHQKRLGRDKKIFTLLKLRTMKPDTGDHASHLVSSSQITTIGKFLRKTKLDELPQIWNVLVGDMSFVGPRPGLPNHIELKEAREKHGVFTVRPGITGPSALNGIDMSTPQKLAESDAVYVAEQSFFNDMRYIFMTAFGRGRGDAVKN